MNYSDKLKEYETKLINLRAQAMAKKRSIEEMLDKRNKAEEEVQSKLGISLEEVPNALAVAQEKLKQICLDVENEVAIIESEFAKINS